MGHMDGHGGPLPHGPASSTHRSANIAAEHHNGRRPEPESHSPAGTPETAEGNCDTLWIDLGGEG